MVAVHRCLAALCLSLALCRGQQVGLATFGTTVVIPGGLTGKVYHIPAESLKLPKFEKLEPVGTIYTKGLFIPSRDFSEGFPGITDRIEWFALDFTGRIYINNPGNYLFSLCSDDGSKLYLDGKTVIDNDGVHGEICLQGGVKLAGGIHTLRLSYFQGPRFHLSLMLGVAGPKEKRFHPFTTDEFQPPSNPADWKYGSPDSLQTAPDPDAGRVRLRDVIRRPEPVMSLSVEVTANGHPVTDLKPADFLVRDEGLPQDITDLSVASQPLDILLLLDAGAATAPFHERLKTDAERTLSQLGSQDRLGILEFAEQQVLTLGLASVPEMILTALRKLRPRTGESDLNSAIALAALYFRDHARPSAARAIVIVTANQGRRGVSDRATRDALWQANVVLSGLLAAREHSGEADVRQFVDASGGEALEMDPANVPLGQAIRDLRARYQISYRAPGGTPKSIRTISVELTGDAKLRLPDAKIRTPGAYVVAQPL